MLHKVYYNLSSWMFVFIIFMIASSAAIAQEYVCVRGRLLDEATKKPLSFATVTLATLPLGVVTGEKGEFVFYVPSKVVHDTLVIRMLGYEQIRMPLLLATKQKEFFLKTRVTSIDEVIIIAIPAVEIVRRALNNLRKNYPHKPFLLRGNFQEFIKEDDKYVRAMEGAVSIYDKDINYNAPSRVDSLSVSIDMIKNKSRIVNSTTGSTYSFYSLFGYFLHYEKVVKNLSYKLEEVRYDGDQKIYVITCGQGNTRTYHINSETYAFIKVETNYSIPTVNKREKKGLFCDLLGRKSVIEFKSYNGLNYPFRSYNEETLRYHTGADSYTDSYIRTTVNQLLVTDVVLHPTLSKSELKKFSNQWMDAYYLNTPKRVDWNNFNALPESEVRKTALKQLFSE